MKKHFALAFTVLCFLSMAAPAAHAFNESYKQGFADGMIYNGQQANIQLRRLMAENARLKQQIQATRYNTNQPRNVAGNTNNAVVDSYTTRRDLDLDSN
jgi:hypothetical protein